MNNNYFVPKIIAGEKNVFEANYDLFDQNVKINQSRFDTKPWLSINDRINIHFNPEGSDILYYGRVCLKLNKAATEIVILITGLTNIDEVVDEITNRYCDDVMKKKIYVTSFINEMINRRLVIPSNKKTYRPATITGDKKSYYPTSVTLELSKLCNLKCKHCFTEADIYQNGISFLLSNWKKIINEIKGKVKNISVTGGEPLLHNEIYHILKYIHDCGLTVKLLTNGTLISGEIAKKLKETGVNIVQVSIESLDENEHDGIRGKGSYRAAIEGILHLLKEKLDVQVAMTIVNENCHGIIKLAKFLSDIGVKKLLIGRVYEIGRAEYCYNSISKNYTLSKNITKSIQEVFMILEDKDFSIAFEDGPEYTRDNCYLLDEQHYLPFRTEGIIATCNCCGAIAESVFITCDGTVRPCPMWEINLGSLKYIETLGEILSLSSTRTFAQIPAPSMATCRDCELLIDCIGCIARTNDKKNCKYNRHYFTNS